jgi:hypothetical protein
MGSGRGMEGPADRLNLVTDLEPVHFDNCAIRLSSSAMA